ncbi:BglG family transcription antiterminator LicT [Bacillus nitratireducens]|uniref:BglG family transcription antiterminator LicT n=1 Tax=Bacillus nitratireducens TaxID=2026193 RepID=UPI000BEE4D6B|nr:PRD domain-containing protein [Bacillus nitratireducens]PEE14741.1 transcription antiterminator LicT [Bacillus cereus]MED0905174.1 PRD domain-containing protein [Bacillus nitratireducens]PFH87617.1 transcription antiterminator LicT [Bacillus cereus]PFM61402.1 transcription antiterminator LicT [Bacillus cereus]PFS17438.1 transcription antiterminator LicT [Bacillus cereus]
MEVKRNLNNNVVITEDKNGKEIIVMGKGIGYQKSKGDVIDESKVNKIFRIANQDISNKLQELLNNIPIEHMKLSDEIIGYAQRKLGKKLNEGIYISLSDHMHNAIQRIKEGIQIKNALLWEIKRFYKDEFNIGMKALDIIERETHIRLPDDEAGFIAFHIVNAQLHKEQPIVHEITQLIQEVLTIVRVNFGIEIIEESVSFYRFISHLKFFASRLITNSTYSDESDEELFEIIKNKYVKEFECVSKIQLFIQKKYGHYLTSNEMIYLTIHVAKVVRESSR